MITEDDQDVVLPHSFRRYDHLEKFGRPECEGIELGRTYIFPKLDGTNAVVWLGSDSVIRCGSRNREISVASDNQGFCAWAMSDDPKAVVLRQLMLSSPNYVVYGEWLCPHTLRTYRDDAWRRFWVFDVYDVVAHRYLSWDEYGPAFITLGLDVVEPLCTILNPTEEQLSAQMETNTFLVQNGAGVGEGIVIKRYDWRNRYNRQPWAKLVRNEFKESNRRAFGFPEKEGEFQVEVAIAEEFCTATLVGKTRAKVIVDIANDNGIDISNDPNAQFEVEKRFRAKLIPQLLGRVFHDLVVEDLWEAVKKHKNPTIDFAKLNKCVTQQVKKLATDLF